MCSRIHNLHADCLLVAFAFLVCFHLIISQYIYITNGAIPLGSRNYLGLMLWFSGISLLSNNVDSKRVSLTLVT